MDHKNGGKRGLDIWLLGGQSNMAGRGQVAELPRSDSSGERVAVFTGSNNWVTPAVHPLHRDVDLCKADRCGVGPGLPFAKDLLDLEPTMGTIGLVPCALGGTSLQEWSPDFELGSAGTSPGIDPQYLHRHGVANPFQALVSRAEAGLAAAPEGSVIRGLLWYQGENDAMDVDDAARYASRFCAWVYALRTALGREADPSSLPVMVVAVTAAAAKLTHLRSLREQIFALPQVLPACAVVDAFGLPQHSDGLHLNTHAQLELGRRLAFAWHEHFPSHGNGRPCDAPSKAQLPEGLGTRMEHRELWRWADEQTRAACVLVHRVSVENEARQAALHEGITKVERDMARLLRALKEREQVLTELAEPGTGEAASITQAPSSALYSSALEGVDSIGEPGLPPLSAYEARQPPLMLSTQQEELLIPSECAPAPPPDPLLPRAPAPSPLVDRGLIDRARQLSLNVDRMVAAALAASSSGQGTPCLTDPPSPTALPSSLHPTPPPSAPVPSPPASPGPSSLPAHLPKAKAEPLATTMGPCGSNFVYGEVDVLSFLHLLTVASAAGQVQEDTDRGPLQEAKGPPAAFFCDLGCGEGRTLLAAAACGRFEKVWGIELLPGLADNARDLAHILASLAQEQEQEQEGEDYGYADMAGRIEVRQEDLFQCPPSWRGASMVYMCATCFESGQMAALASQAAEHLPPHARVILLDKPFPEPLASGLRLLLRCQCLVSWGTAAAYVYEIECD